MDVGQVATLFDQCDVERRGWLTVADVALACPQLSTDELGFIFTQLDVDGDGRVTEHEFVSSFERALARAEHCGYGDLRGRASSLVTSPPPVDTDERPRETFFDSEPETANINTLTCNEDVLALYEHLQASGVPNLLQQFEKIIGGFCKELHTHREQTERLQQIQHREQERYRKQIRDVENELEQQLQQAEEKVRSKEREKLEREKDEMRQQLESEIRELQDNIKRMNKFETTLAGETSKSERLNEMKQKLQDVLNENRQLKTSLTENQVEVAMIKAELVQMRHEYDSKAIDLTADKDSLVAYMHEQEKLSRQLQLLYDANRKLHDTNDSLRSALEAQRHICRQYQMRTPSPCSDSVSRAASRGSLTVASLHSLAPTPDADSPGTDDDLDSGLVADAAGNRLAAPFDIDYASSVEATYLSDSASIPVCMRVVSTAATCVGIVHEQVSFDTPVDGSVASLTRGRPRDFDHFETIIGKHMNETAVDETRSPDRTFRVVMAGDAAVGKSSIIMRLTKNLFQPNLPSTLGVDFHIKTLLVDDKQVALQLWDTAGQERFRSMCKSYFRRADGALLVYDCTNERSFVNVRSWMSTIEESAPRKIPVLVCANKVDARTAATADFVRCVSRQDGAKLAKLYDALFAEVSAKEGTSVAQSAVDLSRELLAQEDCDVKCTSLVLRQPVPESRRCASSRRCN